MAESAKRQAGAAAEQASVTRQMFEASHRPYLAVEVQRRSFYISPEHFGLFVTVTNYGAVPAILLGWRARLQTPEEFTAHDEPPTEQGLCVFPGKDRELASSRGAGRTDLAPHPEADVYVEVPYRGFHRGVRHETRIGVTGKFNQWTARYEEVT